MMRSLFSGVAGLKTHQTKMDVIGNNIANVNTTAYKSQSITFQDLLYQTTQNASGANATTGAGGTNARQIGLGAKTGAISTAISTQGSAQSTNNPFDIMITGDSFFVVSNGSENFFTRDGSFNVDGVGNLVMSSTGYTVMGWQTDAEENIVQDTVTPLRIMSAENMTYPPEATSLAYVSGIVDKNDTNVNATSGKVMSLSFYDNLGYQYNARFSIHAIDGDAGQFYIQLDKILDSTGNEVTTANESFGDTLTVPDVQEYLKTAIDPTKYQVVYYNYTDTTTGEAKAKYGIFEAGLSSTDITFANDQSQDGGSGTKADLAGAYGIADATGKVLTFDSSTGIMTSTGSKEVTDSAYITFDPYTGFFSGIGTNLTGLTAASATASITFPGAENFSTIAIDFANATMFNNNGTSTVAATSGNTQGFGTGRRLGEMSGVAISKDGIITASYDNGQSRVLGQIAVANFANPAGLEKSGDNLYSATANSGQFDGIGEDITAGGNYMTTGVLEMSNVDLAGEFTDMITTQRGFQANSRIITVSDTLLEELVNLKR